MNDMSEWEKKWHERRMEKVNKTNDFIILLVVVMFLLMAVRLVWLAFT